MNNSYTIEEFRIDGRKEHEIRNITIQNQLINNKYYIFYSQGETRLTCHIEEYDNKNFTKFKLKTQININNTTCERNRRHEFIIDELDEIISNSFEPLILSTFNFIVHIDVMQDDGNLSSAAINAISTLLAVNNIQMTDMCISSEVLKMKNRYLYDPNKNEKGGKRLLVSRLINRKTFTYFLLTGNLLPDEISSFYEEVTICSEMIYSVIQSFLKQNKHVIN